VTAEKRAFWGGLAGSANFVVTFGLMLVQVPWLLRCWGAELYGAWNAVFAFYSLVITLDTGHQSYLGSLFLQTYHADRDRLRQELGSGIRAALVLSFLQVAFCLAIGVYGLDRVIGVESAVATNTEITLSFLALLVQWTIAGSVGGIVVRIYSAGGQYSRATIWGIGFRIVFSGGLCWGAWWSGRLFPAVLAACLGVTIYTFVQAVDIRRMFPDLYPWWRDGDWARGRSNLRQSLVLTFSGVIQQFSVSGLTLVLTHALNTTALSLVTTLRTLTNTATQATLIVVQPVLPDLIKYHAAGDGAKVRDALGGVWFASGVAVNFGLVAAVVVAPWFYVFWTRGVLPFDGVLFALLALGVQVRNFSMPLLSYLSGLNDLRSQLEVAVAQTVATTGIAALTVEWLGVRAAGVGVLAGELAVAVLAVRAARRVGRAVGFVPERAGFLFAGIGLAVNGALYAADQCWPALRATWVAAALMAFGLLAWVQYGALSPDVRARLRRVLAPLVSR
jgi:O-antigen/teichoic acid export membrane protein